ncbi:EF-hand domain-containing protein [Cryptosporidium canis]|uniref:EF-hand domain-containing protein n=1 Tax=Cryptosporidium canis TaxID=195482 RepID=A0ABQ8PBN1_9CRYT|nr:EF-hand domain-containing protein [Cryptosporidium canis]KAJ1615384.1 EF-hand domain-containing protein [Cryptosporidium canis]
MKVFVYYLYLSILLVICSTFGGARAEPSQIEKEFSEFDLNSDGFIDAQEIRTIRTAVTLQELHQFFWEIDVDSSGTISLQEYSHFVAANAHTQHNKENVNQHS